jgi:hypothetical protein
MMHKFAVLLAAVSAVTAAPIKFTREVPQEHSHEQFLTSVRASLQKNNPDQIQDPVFGLLGNAAASQGQGKITNTDCLQQATADQAFTNAKAAKDITGMVNALVYRALERNTGKVGLASVLCTAIKAKNPEIAALQQHQDPASSGAKDLNKKITLELAKQIASVGGDPLIALKSGTFAPGNLNDNTGKGNTCDDANDPVGCIFTQNLLVEDATEAEILAAVGQGGSGGSNAGDKTANGNNGNGNNNDSGSVDPAASCGAPEIVTVTVTATSTAATSTSSSQSGSQGGSQSAPPQATGSSSTPSPSGNGSQSNDKGNDTPSASTTQTASTPTSTSNPPAPVSSSPAAASDNNNNNNNNNNNGSSNGNGSAASDNLQTFTAALGGAAAPPVTKGGKGFIVNGDEFLNLSAAIGRSCDIQHNACANAANASRTAGFTVGDCDKQNDQCKAAAN